MLEMQGPTFEKKSVALSIAIMICTLCQELLLVHVHQFEASGCSLANLSTISCEQTGTSPWMCISTNNGRRSLPHVDLKNVFIRYKVLTDLSLEQLVTGNNTRMSGYRLVACGIPCDGEAGRQTFPCCSICFCHLIFQLKIWWDTLSGDAISSS